MENSEKAFLYLVRHGATTANEQRPYILQGSSIDFELSETGVLQAESVGKFLADQPLSAIYSSPLKRAAATAEQIAKHHGLSVTFREEIIEVDVGQWERMSWVSIEQDYPENYRAFRADSGFTPYLGGESYANVLQRVKPVFDQLLKDHLGQSIAVVAHNVVNRVYLAHLLGLDVRLAKDIEQTNACVNIIEYAPEKNRTRVMTMNSDFHVPKGGGPGA
ncbi:histidine phosphatase family protein [Calycomorphotria hydatis]|uniref:Phosphoserine phosphatase 1 n=1 Tax=Calycomorphotria hydatis TaxID=2528027 RepID=A0A517T846_9PLAN|nr:histidine phosphatase family protein [Calycomorphotria hydatis]QDT64546.1 Phosphoserine phosphatase 1 [Calycomorphotria hydatis]